MMPRKIGEYCWWGKNCDFKYQKVGKKKPNPWGLHDILGNVIEWTLDQYDPGYYAKSPAANPWNKATKPYPHVARGGSWDDDEPDEAARGGAAGVGRDLEDPGSAASEEHLVSHRRAVPRLPHRAPAEDADAGRRCRPTGTAAWRRTIPS